MYITTSGGKLDLDHFPSGAAIGYAGETQAVNLQKEKETNSPP